MNKCLNCNKEVVNKYCNVSCQNTHQGATRSNKQFGLFKDFEVECYSCKNKFLVNEREKIFPKKEKYYCNRSCANKRTHSDETKEKIRTTLNKHVFIKLESTCIFCKKDYIKKRNHQKLCSRTCSSSWKNTYLGIGRLGGLASAKSQSETKRSKNEIYFAELCETKFVKVLTNEPVFNGWDADVIIEDFKIAIL